jgi:predicted metal-binding protein
VRILKDLARRFFGKRNEDSEVRNIKELDGADSISISRCMVAQKSNYVQIITMSYT